METERLIHAELTTLRAANASAIASLRALNDEMQFIPVSINLIPRLDWERQTEKRVYPPVSIGVQGVCEES